MGGGGKSEVNGTHPSVCALLPRTTKRNLRKHSFIVCSVYSRNNPPAAKCLSARQTSTQSPQKPSPASVTIVTGHRCRPVLINVHGTPSCLIEVLLHPTRSPYGLKLRDSGRCLEFWNKSRSARGEKYRRSTLPSKLVTPTNTIAFSDFAVWFLTLLRIHTQFWLPKEVSSFCLVAEWVRLGIGTATASFVEL